jgi:S-methylmethionine-dependent homocysteine/selenocysteine methylase
MCFNKQINLPEFAAYDLMRDEKRYEILFDYYKTYAEISRQYGLGLVLETPTWRANSDWGRKLGDSAEALHQFNVDSVKLIEHIREEYETEEAPIIISGCIGPRGDGYSPENMMTAAQAKDYHSAQIDSFSTSNVDLVSAITLNYIDETIGITQAAGESRLPVCISFTVETDGLLPTGETLEQAIAAVGSATESGPAYYMINCAHPGHFDHLFTAGGTWLERIKGIRANASCLSHAELDESETLDDGHPETFGKELGDLKTSSPYLSVLGGCCGTDHRHIEQICRQLKSA